MIKAGRNLWFLVAMVVMVFPEFATGENLSFSVIVDKSVNGTLDIDPAPAADGTYPAGSVLTLTATPAPGYVLDSLYFSVPGRFGQMYHESMASPFKVTVDQETHVGASFIEASAVAHLNVIQNVVYAKPGVKPLKYDVYSPKGAESLPIIVIIHGGGWSANTEDIMRGMARELTRSGTYVVCSIDYRWAQTADGDAAGNTMADLIGDVFGAIAHIMEHAGAYGGDPSKIALTGDSAGGHLSAAAANMCDRIGTGGFGKRPGVFEFLPSYLPKNKSIEKVRSEIMSAIRVAAPSYGVFGGSFLNHYSDDPAADDAWRKAIAPIHHIPDVKERAASQYLLRGTEDFLITDEMVRSYAEALEKAGQRAEYVQVPGAGHAFFDWKPDTATKATFETYGVVYCREMETFFDSIFYADR